MNKKPTYEDLEKEISRLKGEIQEKENTFNQILNSISDGFFTLNNELEVVLFNDSAEILLGRKRQDVIGVNLFDAFPEAKGSIFEEKYTLAVKEKKILTFETYFDTLPYENWYEVRVYPHQSGITVYFQVVTERKQKEEALRKSEEQFRGLVEDTPGMICQFLPSWEIVFVNKAYCECFEKQPKDFIGQNFLNLIPEADRTRIVDNISALTFESPIQTHEHKVFTSSGEIRWQRWSNRAIFNDEGQAIEYQAIGYDISEIKQAEALFKQSEERLSLIIKGSNDAPWDWDLTTNELYYSPQWWKQIGYDEDELPNDAALWQHLMHPNDSDRVNNFFQNALKDGTESYEVEFRLQHKKKYYITVLSRGYITRDAEGTPIRVSGTNMDLTDRKYLEQSLKERDIRFAAVGDNLPAGQIYQLKVEPDGTSRCTYVSAAVEQLHECTVEQALSDPSYLFSRVVEEDLETLAKATEKSIIELCLFDCVIRIRRKSGELRIHRMISKPRRMDDGSTLFDGIDMDITDHKIAEEAIKQEKEKAEKYLKIAGVMFIGLDFDGNVNLANDKACGILEYDQNEIIGMNWFDNFIPAEIRDDVHDIFKQLIVGDIEPVEYYENEVLTKTGAIIHAAWHNTVIKNVDNQIIGILGSGEDITEKRRLEKQVFQQQKLESIGILAGGIAHLFNNYLYAVSGNLELALEYLPNDSSIHNYLIEAMKSARKCADVSGSMLHYLGQNFVKTQSLDISEFCRKILSDFQSQSSVNSGITIETDIIDTELLVRANASQMQQVMNHLITNASESIGEKKGRIHLTTKTMSASDIPKIHLLPVDSKPSADNYVCVEITDTGCGISKEDLHKISDPFFTTKFTGRGLGLAVVSGIVKSWGGFIGVRSKVGHGSSFMVFLPLSEDNSIRQSQKLAQSLQPQQKEFSTILLVDDNTAVLKMTTIMLKKMGFEVISAVNGVEAVEKFRQHKESIGCLITDLSMPELDGWGTLAEIRKIKPDIPAVLASGYDEAFAMSRDDSEKPQAFLHKPYTMKDLKGALSQAINS